MRHYQGDIMKPICPNCHSAHVIENMDNNMQGMAEDLFSPKLLAGIGASVCKYYKINPMIGMVAGGAIYALPVSIPSISDFLTYSSTYQNTYFIEQLRSNTHGTFNREHGIRWRNPLARFR